MEKNILLEIFFICCGMSVCVFENTYHVIILVSSILLLNGVNMYESETFRDFIF